MTTSIEMLNEVAAVSISKYSEQLKAGLRGQPYLGARVRISETVHYLKLWMSMIDKGMKAETLTLEEKRELKEAINDRFGVHILREGRTLCGRIWIDLQEIDRHTLWVGFEDEKLIEFANCLHCLQTLDRVKE